MTISLECSVVVSEDVLFREVDEESVLLDLNTGYYFGLDGTGTEMFQAVSKAETIKAALEYLESIYKVDRQRLETDLLDLLGQLQEIGLVKIEQTVK